MVAETLQRRIKDPRLGYVTITDTRVTGDLREATVFYTVYGDDEERARLRRRRWRAPRACCAPRSAGRPGCASPRRWRSSPDALPDNARTIDDLLAKARASDAEVRETAAGATYAGDADPYRKPADEDELRRRRSRTHDAARASAPTAWSSSTSRPGCTSHDVVARMRGSPRTRRVGHAGTLDPMATGVLVLGVEKATRLLGHLALTEKEYEATIRLGQTTVTDDAEGEVTATAPPPGVTREAHRRRGAPAHRRHHAGAVQGQRHQGRRHALATRGCARARSSSSPARPVTVSSFHGARTSVGAATEDGTDRSSTWSTSTSSSAPPAPTSGRSPATSAPDLGVGGHLTALRRTRVGPYRLDAGRARWSSSGGVLRRPADRRGRRRRRSPAGTSTRNRHVNSSTAYGRRRRDSVPGRSRSSPRTTASSPWWRSGAARRRSSRVSCSRSSPSTAWTTPPRPPVHFDRRAGRVRDTPRGGTGGRGMAGLDRQHGHIWLG